MDRQTCMNCEREFDKNELHWISDNYGIPFKKVCDECYETVEDEIRNNHYGDYLSDYELYGEG